MWTLCHRVLLLCTFLGKNCMWMHHPVTHAKIRTISAVQLLGETEKGTCRYMQRRSGRASPEARPVESRFGTSSERERERGARKARGQLWAVPGHSGPRPEVVVAGLQDPVHTRGCSPRRGQRVAHRPLVAAPRPTRQRLARRAHRPRPERQGRRPPAMRLRRAVAAPVILSRGPARPVRNSGRTPTGRTGREP
jgi:hypothetical protein